MSIYDLPVEPITARGKAAGLAIYALSRLGKVKLADVADKLDIRARILRDIAPAVGMSTTGNPLDLPVARQRNLEWAADEIETAGELIRRLGSTVPRTAQDTFNEYQAEELSKHREFLLGLVRKNLSPLRLRALDALIDWHFASTLGEKLGISIQHAGNVCAALYGMGLVERKDAPRHLAGRSPWLYRTVDAVHGPEREAADIEAIRENARRIHNERKADPDA